MHIEAINFTLFVKKILNNFFIGKRVLDVGSGDINGNNRYLFEECEYHGNDVIKANNVTIVSKTSKLPFQNNVFDTIISTECFEHDPEYKESFIKIYNMLKPDGLFFFTCASTGRTEHGTIRTTPSESYGTIGNLQDMSDYYKNLTEIDLNEALPLNNLFSVWDTYYNCNSKDLYFVGIKKGNSTFNSLEKYVENGVVITSSNIDNIVKKIFHLLCENKAPNKWSDDIMEHLVTLYNYTKECDSVFETGVRSCNSSWAFLYGLLDGDNKNPKRLFLNDIDDCYRNIENLLNANKTINNGIVDIKFEWKNNLLIEFDDTYDITFIDTWHVYGQLKRELEKFSKITNKYIIMHDTTIDEIYGESHRSFDDNIEQQSKETNIPVDEIKKGLGPAIDEFLQNNQEWYLKEKFTNNNGLTILAKNKQIQKTTKKEIEIVKNIFHLLCENKAPNTNSMDIMEHLVTLYNYTKECDSVFETGVRSCNSSWAFLYGLLDGDNKNPKRLFLNDIDDCYRNIENLLNANKTINNGIVDIKFEWKNNLLIEFDDTYDITFIDTWHVYGQLKRELEKFSKITNKYIIMHDTTIDEIYGESHRSFDDNIEQQSKETNIPVDEIKKGLGPAIDEFLQNNQEWYLKEKFTNNNGLTILAKKKQIQKTTKKEIINIFYKYK